jgi:hypothetical protein
MCRSIHTLYNIDPPVNEEEIRSTALQYVRKISGFTKPSKANQVAFQIAVDEVTLISTRLLASLETHTPPRERRMRAKFHQEQESRVSDAIDDIDRWQ